MAGEGQMGKMQIVVKGDKDVFKSKSMVLDRIAGAMSIWGVFGRLVIS